LLEKLESMNTDKQKTYKRKEKWDERTLSARPIKNDLTELIQNLLFCSGLSNAKIAEQIGISAPQFGRFLMGEATLSINSLNKCLDLLRVDLTPIMERNKLAQEIAEKLKEYELSNIDKFTKRQIIELSGVKELHYFPEIKDLVKEGGEIKSRDIFYEALRYIDVESTFDYMKELISYYLEIEKTKDKISYRQAKRSIFTNIGRPSKDEESIFEKILNATPFAAFATMGIGLLGAITSSLLEDDD
jgi:transcriptional regulator with XRE-family HTH domain